MSDTRGDGSEVALVTGGGSGIGEATAHELARRGHAVAVLDLEPERAQRVAGELQGAGAEALAVPADVRDEASVAAAVALVEEGLGPIGVLVSSAGIGDAPGPTVDSVLDDWQRVIDINLRGTFLCARLVARGMLERGRGAIVNIASIVGQVGILERTAYGPSKAGVINLTRTLAAEWAPHGVRVNAVAPGFVLTPLLQESADQGRVDLDALAARIPAGRLARTDEIAKVIAFLAGDDASFVNGATLTVDGAHTAVITTG